MLYRKNSFHGSVGYLHAVKITDVGYEQIIKWHYSAFRNFYDIKSILIFGENNSNLKIKRNTKKSVDIE